MRALGPLAVAGAFHTTIMQPADAKLSEALAGVPIRAPEIPVVSNVDAAIHESPDAIRELLIRQVVSPVLWEDSLRAMIANGRFLRTRFAPSSAMRSSSSSNRYSSTLSITPEAP